MPRDLVPLKPSSKIQYLKGVGPRMAEVFAEIGIYTVGDLISTLPKKYQRIRFVDQIKDLGAVELGERVRFYAEVFRVHVQSRAGGKMVVIQAGDFSGKVRLRFFRLPYRGFETRFRAGARVEVVGVWQKNEFHHPEIKDNNEPNDSDHRLIPLYPVRRPLSQSRWQQWVLGALEAVAPFLDEILDIDEQCKWRLPSRVDALKEVHQPSPELWQELMTGQQPCQRRLAFDELLDWQRDLLNDAGVQPGLQVEPQSPSLPFELTEGQKKTWLEIANDLSSGQRMCRLVMGDVGSGKTVLALMAAYSLLLEGYQVALMAPTEILVDQHVASARCLLPKALVHKLTGKLKGAEREKLLVDIRGESPVLVVGTQALIGREVRFSRLGLVIIDEQQRFGVAQRDALFKKGENPHRLLLSATPIPLTLAQALFGEMAISRILDRPKGRQPVRTILATGEQRSDTFQSFIDSLKQGEQGYLVFPSLEEGDEACTVQFQALKEKHPELPMEMLHGQLASVAKDRVMSRFRSGKVRLLVATSVIEVGVDVPHATRLWIEAAHRFGLSQLHQLRGRVGRGTLASYCYLSSLNPERIAFLENCDNGFEVADKDLELRGPGDALLRQHGWPQFQIADLFRHSDLLEFTRHWRNRRKAQDFSTT